MLFDGVEDHLRDVELTFGLEFRRTTHAILLAEVKGAFTKDFVKHNRQFVTFCSRLRLLYNLLLFWTCWCMMLILIFPNFQKKGLILQVRFCSAGVITLSPGVFTFGELGRAMKLLAASKVFWMAVLLLLTYSQLFILVPLVVLRSALDILIESPFYNRVGFPYQISVILVGSYTTNANVARNFANYDGLMALFYGTYEVLDRTSGWQPKRQFVFRLLLFSMYYVLPFCLGTALTAITSYILTAWERGQDVAVANGQRS